MALTVISNYAANVAHRNIDIANEFTAMIVTQQAYSASVRIIATADEMLQEILQIAR